MSAKLQSRKVLEALLYVAPRVDGDLYTALKALYLADKCHLENYGRQIYGDRYRAMEHGPTASKAYDTLKDLRDQRTARLGVKGAHKAMQVSNDNLITALREPDLSELSRSEIYALDSACSELAGKDFGEARRATHDDAWKATPRNNWMSIEAIAAQLPDGPELIEHLKNRFPEDLAENNNTE